MNGKTQTDNSEFSVDAHTLPGDPNCPICHGLGYIRQDLPVGHPEFGKLQICTCRHAQIRQQVHERLFSLSHLNELSHLSFENFQIRGRIGYFPAQADSLERAYNQARHFAQTLNGWLLLQGKNGCGKTHLAAAIANQSVGAGVPTLFITVPDLLDSLRFAYQDPEASFEERFEDIRSSSLLVLDDFGTQNATPWAQEKLFQILNYRYINHLPLVVTTNLDLRDIEPRIRSRLEDPDLVTNVSILAPDYRNPASDFGDHELSSLALYTAMTFASFDLRKSENIPADELKSLEAAFTAAQEYARDPSGWIVFTGPYGCGKTHLAAAIGHHCLDNGYDLIFVSVPELLDHLRATFSPSSTISLDRLFEEVKTTQLLILDDLDTGSSTTWSKEKLYQLFNYRYLSRLPTVITTSSEYAKMDSRLLSRMEDRRLCTIHAIICPAYRGQPGKSVKAKRRGYK